MTEPAPRRGRLRRLVLRLFLLVVVPLAAVVVSLHLYARGGRYVETENAYVKAHVVAITPEVPGRVVWVGIQDNQVVSAGESLFRIDPEPFRIALAEAEARLAITHTEIETLRANYREAVVGKSKAEDDVAFMKTQLQRQRRLRDKRMGSEERYDQARHDLAIAERELQAARERIRTVLLALGNDPDLPVGEHARFLQAKAERDRAALDLDRTEVLAPAAGIVSNMKLQAGEYVEDGDPVFTLIQSEPVWVEANLKETQLTHVSEGQRVSVEVDAYPGRVWQARVDTIAPATGAEFALLPPQNATGNWVKVVQRVPVQLAIERPADAPVLRAGMTATVSIDTGHVRELPAIAQRLLGEGGLLEPFQGLVGRALAWGRTAD
jgi:membrane fusion protein (multidrug efflux system)